MNYHFIISTVSKTAQLTKLLSLNNYDVTHHMSHVNGNGGFPNRIGNTDRS